MKNYVLPFILIIIATALCSCYPITELSGTWKKQGYTGINFKKIIVVAISNDVTKRNSVEKSVASTIESHKINATTSEKIIDFSKVDKNNDGKIDSIKRNELLKILADSGYDGALVISLLDIKEEKKYVPGDPAYEDDQSFYTYSVTTHDLVSTPGYYIQIKKIYIESRLFDLTKDEKLWSSKSVTKDPANIKNFSKSLSKAIVNALIKDAAIK
jgi:hypothetical protein